MRLGNSANAAAAGTYLLAFGGALCAAAAYAHGISDADKESMVAGGLLDYVRLGASHMLTGYDHLLFLFGVVFFLDNFKDIVKFITAFTVGHSITLIFATFMKITANYYLIDAVIALTVAYKGFDNLNGFQKFLNMKSPNLVKLVFCFGLIHGFGLSTRLQQLPLGNSGLLLKIISFNVGVELGQVVALTAMVFLLARWRKRASFMQFSAASNFGLIVAGALLLLMQLHGYSHEVFADELKFSGTSHARLHAEMAKSSAAVKSAASDGWQDIVTITVPAGKGLEYKFQMVKGSVLDYAWDTGGAKLDYDFHGDPKGAAEGKEQSYEEKAGSTSSGSLTAPFDGKHGWWWKNNGPEAVKITLKTKGSYEVIGIM